jgi:hypothetical protein
VTKVTNRWVTFRESFVKDRRFCIFVRTVFSLYRVHLGPDTVHSRRSLKDNLEKLTTSVCKVDIGNHLQDHIFYTAQNDN